MNEYEKKLEYPFGDTLPESAKPFKITEGIYWIRMPLPFALDHINLWLIKDEFEGQTGWTIVDCGINKEPVKERWQEIFKEFFQDTPVLRVIVTHMHPDHVGLAGWLCEQFNVPLYMSMTDYFVAQNWQAGGNEGAGTGGEAAVRHFARHGLQDQESQEKIRQRATYYPGLVGKLPATYRRLLDGDVLTIGGDSWQLISGYGHAPEHMALYNTNKHILISGDMLLPKISTNVSVFDYEPLSNPLALYLESIKKFLPLPEDTLILPSHGRPFKNLHERVRQQQEHHEERLAELLDFCEDPVCVVDVVPMMFKRKLDLHQLTFAMGEALAHLHYLYFENKVKMLEEADGVVRFQKK